MIWDSDRLVVVDGDSIIIKTVVDLQEFSAGRRVCVV